MEQDLARVGTSPKKGRANHTGDVKDDRQDQQLHTTENISDFGSGRLARSSGDTSDHGDCGKEGMLSIASSCICLPNAVRLRPKIFIATEAIQHTWKVYLRVLSRV